MAAVALTTDTSVLTSVANDYGFERVFARQIEALGRRRRRGRRHLDERRSPNVLEALRAARARGLRTVALTGRDGGALGSMADVHINVPRRRPPRACRRSTSTLLHAMCEIVERAMATGRTCLKSEMPELRTETMTVNMGPQHPSTHGVLRLVLELSGETVVAADTDDRLPPHRHREDRRAEEVAAGDPARRADGLPRRAVEHPGLLPLGRAAARRRDAGAGARTSAC